MENESCALCNKAPRDSIQLQCRHVMCYSCAELYADTVEHGDKEVFLIHCRKCKSETVTDNIKDLMRFELENFQSFNQQITQTNEKSNSNRLQPTVTDFLNEDIDQDQFEAMLKEQMSQWSSKQFSSDETKHDLQSLNVMLVDKPPQVPILKEKLSLLPVSEHQTEQASYEEPPSNKVSIPKLTLLCQKHNQDYQLMCASCKLLCCMTCVLKDKTHANHKIQTLNELVQKQALPKEFDRRHMKQIDETLRVLQQNEKLIVQTLKSYSQRLKSEFGKLINQIKERQQQIEHQLEGTFLSLQNEINEKRQHIDFLKSSAEQYRLIYEQRLNGDTSVNEVDIYLFLSVLVQASKSIPAVSPIKQEELMVLDFPSKTQLSEQIQRFGRFTVQIQRQLSSRKLTNITNRVNEPNPYRMLFHDSKILNPGIVQQTYQCKVFPQFKETQLLYRHSTQGFNTFYTSIQGQSPVLLVLAVEQFIFGCYLPTPITTSDKYQSSQSCFIFSLNNFYRTQPLKFNIKQDKQFIALFHGMNHICLGSTLHTRQDLLINFASLNKSCSNIGYAYKVDPNVDGQKVLAGQYTDWDVKEFEVYRVC